ncbi:hypothetical protein D3C86_2019790 [compost metagenome]
MLALATMAAEVTALATVRAVLCARGITTAEGLWLPAARDLEGGTSTLRQAQDER